MGVDALLAIGGLIFPPVFDFIKKKFISASNDTPERTIGALATTNPEALAGYTAGIAAYLKSQVDYFNRDVTGTPSQIIIDLRAGIRPVAVIIAGVTLLGLAIAACLGVKIDPSIEPTLAGVRYTCETVVSSWFGNRIALHS